MLKFAADSKEPGKPSIVGLGLSFENLRRLRADAIQFHGHEVGLGSGVFVIAHVDDPQLPTYQQQYGEHVCELVILTERVCQQFETGAPVVNIPLKATRRGRPCEAVLFAGETEESLVENMRTAGLVTAATSIVGPDRPSVRPAPTRTETESIFRVSVLHRLVLAAGGLGFVAVTAMLAARPRMETWILEMMIAVAAVFLGLLALRWTERVEIDDRSIRCRRPIGGFEVPWSDVAAIEARKDSLGPYELFVVRRSGQRHKLRRIYASWDDLVDAITSRAR